jgi:hypothetical protein
MRTPWLTFLAAGCVACRSTPQAAPPAPDADVACYRASRPLGYSADGAREAADAAAARFELLPAGEVRRAGLAPARLADGSRNAMGWRGDWRRAGDTLHVRFSTGSSGWSLALLPDAPGLGPRAYVGTATYGSDAIVRGQAPWSATVTVLPERCEDAPGRPARSSTEP